MNFDLGDVRSFLEFLVLHVAGLGGLNIESCVGQITVMPVDTDLVWQFNATHDGRSIPMSVRAVASDVDAIELYFGGDPELTSLIQNEMRSWKQ